MYSFFLNNNTERSLAYFACFTLMGTFCKNIVYYNQYWCGYNVPFFFFNLFYWSIVDLQFWVFVVQQSDCYTYIYVPFHILFHHDLSQGIESSSLYSMGLPKWLSGKESACNAGDTGLIPGPGRSPGGGGNGNPLQHSCLENSKNRRAWCTTVHGVAKSQTRLSNWATDTLYCRTCCLSILYVTVCIC